MHRRKQRDRGYLNRRSRESRIGCLEGIQRLVFTAQERAIEADSVRVIILIVDAIAKVERILVVDLQKNDWSVRIEERAQHGREELKITRGLTEERLARVAWYGEGER